LIIQIHNAPVLREVYGATSMKANGI